MTGGSASYGISSKNAIELALKQINAKGGVNGKKLSLVAVAMPFEVVFSPCSVCSDEAPREQWPVFTLP